VSAACDSARLRVSLALDGELDDVGRLQLDRHLHGCAECSGLAARMTSAVQGLRAAPRERFRCEPVGMRPPRSTSPAARHWAGAAVAVLAVVLVTGALPVGGTTPPRPERPTASPSAARLSPLELPIGQRSAMDDFAAPTRAGDVASAAPPRARG
jgi:predicted anti-sigma-YlaC factor YlaD